MFMADSEGYIDDIGGKDVGGHAYVLIGANRLKQSKHGIGAVRILNSWGTGWEDHGRAWISFEMLRWLLSQDGEACAATELVAINR
jgi:C1A family cysteine protease